MAVYLIKYRHALDFVKSGMIVEAISNPKSKLTKEWTSLPGASEEGMTLPDFLKTFKEGVSRELNGKSAIATPKGQLLTE